MPENDNDSIEVTEIGPTQGLDLFDVKTPVADEASTVTATPGEALQTGTSAPPPPEMPGSQLPEWFREIPEADRAGVLSSALAALPLEERMRLAPVAELLGQVQNLTAAQVQEQSRRTQEDQQRQAYLDNEAATFYDWAEERLDVQDMNELRQKTGVVVDVAQRDYHNRMARSVEDGLLAAYSRLGMGANNLPQTLVAAVGQAQDYGGVIRAYVDAAADRGFELGRLAERNTRDMGAKSDETALRARIRNEELGRLGKEGRVRLTQDGDAVLAELVQNTPPSLSGTPAASGDDIDQAEFDEAMRDPDAYERLMGNPTKAAALRKLMAGALSG